MKRVIVILAVLFTVNVIADTPVSPNYEQAGKLVAAAWKFPPRSIDITYYAIVKDNTKTEQELRRIYEEAHEQMYGPPEQLNSYMLESRERFVQMNVERFLKEQQEGGRKYKLRIRFDGNRQRVDKVYGPPARTVLKGTAQEEFLPEKKLDVNTPFETSSIEITDQNNVSERFEYLHESKTATRRKIKTRAKFEDSEIMRFMMIPGDLLLRMKLGTRKNGLFKALYEPNETNIEQLCSGTLNGISIKIQPDKDVADLKEEIEISFYNNDKTQFYKSTMVCAKEDYSKVYYYEARNPVTDHPIFARTCGNFDSQGFPHNVTVIEYDGEGKVKLHETYHVESVRLNTPIPDEVFEFNPPKDYAVTDLRLTPAEQQTAEISRLKEWLGHKKWTDRLRALVALGKYLRDNPAELRDIAAPMLDDERPEIREKAAKILQRIESNK